jgi:hypothetical protein
VAPAEIVAHEQADWLFAQMLKGFGSSMYRNSLADYLGRGEVPTALLTYARSKGIEATRAAIKAAEMKAIEDRSAREEQWRQADADAARRAIAALGIR